jgi:hypothetical protein
MRTAHRLLLGVAVITLSACASTPSAPPTVDVTGPWAGNWQYDNPTVGAGSLRGTLKQSGSNVTGSFDVTGPVVNRTANVIGTVSGNVITFSQPVSGSMTVTGNEMNGWFNGLNSAKVTMKKQ